MPGSGDWNTATNWTGSTVPNGSSDTATFDDTNTAGVSISANTEVNGITFTATAAAYTITANATFTLTISGVGITNNSGIAQNFVTAVNGTGGEGAIVFNNSATAGTGTEFNNEPSIFSGVFGGFTQFNNTSTAGSGIFENHASTTTGALGGLHGFQQQRDRGHGHLYQRRQQHERRRQWLYRFQQHLDRRQWHLH